MKSLKSLNIYALLALFLIVVGAVGLLADYPSWWIERGAIDTNLLARDYALVNQGQVKWMATNAYDEMEENLPGGAGTNVANLVFSFSDSNNYSTVNLGQLKFLSSPFYDRLIEESYTTSYPWSENTDDDSDYAPANIGQLKHVFSFDLTDDDDADGLPDWWETEHFGSITNYDGSGNPDGDDWTNAFEYVHGLNPTNLEYATDDNDNDGYINSYEIFHNAHCGSASDYPEATILVPGDASSIQGGIDLATNDYDIVMVAAGRYTNELDKNLDFEGKKIMLTSVSGPSETIIDCDTNGRAIYFHSGEDRESVVNGFRMSGGAANYGAGIYCLTSSPIIQNCEVIDNSSYFGNGIDIEGNDTNSASPIIRSCTVSQNANVGISIVGRGDTFIQDCTIDNNTRGGILCGISTSYWGPTVTVTRCTISSNTTTYEGAAILVFDAANRGRQTKCLVSECLISGNDGDSIVYVRDYANLLLDNCAIIDNGRVESGFAVRNIQANLSVRNCTISGNISWYHGAGIYANHLSKIGTTLVTNSIVWGNLPAYHQIYEYDTNTLCKVYNSCFEGNYPTNILNYTVFGSGNVTNDPILMADNYHLMHTNSSCIDTGSGSLTTDIDGESRPEGAGIDIGCDEFYLIDTDSDGLFDTWEIYYWGDLSATATNDCDDDGLLNSSEYSQLTNPISSDTDGDNLPDGVDAYPLLYDTNLPIFTITYPTNGMVIP